MRHYLQYIFIWYIAINSECVDLNVSIVLQNNLMRIEQQYNWYSSCLHINCGFDTYVHVAIHRVSV